MGMRWRVFSPRNLQQEPTPHPPWMAPSIYNPYTTRHACRVVVRASASTASANRCKRAPPPAPLPTPLPPVPLPPGIFQWCGPGRGCVRLCVCGGGCAALSLALKPCSRGGPHRDDGQPPHAPRTSLYSPSSAGTWRLSCWQERAGEPSTSRRRVLVPRLPVCEQTAYHLGLRPTTTYHHVVHAKPPAPAPTATHLRAGSTQQRASMSKWGV